MLPALLFTCNVQSLPVQEELTVRRKRAQVTTNTAPWGLARISQATKLQSIEKNGFDDDELPLRGKTHDWTFTYDDTWGYGVSWGVSYRDTYCPGWAGAATDDVCNHGTGVASLIAGATLGIAKQASIVPVRIADANRRVRVDTSSADAAAGVNWAVSDYKARNSPTAGIINISWQAIAAGMHVIVAAGNADQNQCFNGPAQQADWRVRDVGHIVVGMTDYDDIRAQLSDVPRELGSNFGPCLTLFAPGYSMTFASGDDDSAMVVQSGTSFAAPLVAGTVAAYVTMHGNQSPVQMKTLLLQNAVTGARIRDLDGSPDNLLQAPILAVSEVQ
ncbi:peptidase S8/S53 domain-containing protein [Mycena alexandri]|uniref:Peptidase S8/S53 domain-containing protein n=1 Tax=Mycena alexandri TaxID=1745969 RepID=A0AAD6S3U6_9AGAR|nr:peptidase S8/S53 domain-containing protein [Mycena alexandri]